MVDFKSLKANSGKKSLETLSAELQKMVKNETRTEDTRFWKPTVDKAGNGYAVIRFLPPPGDESVPYVRIFDHGFQGPGGWYIENSLTTIGLDDPVSEHNSKLWNSGHESDKDIARKQKRRLSFISNIYVVSDLGNKDNEGKVFLYKYGKKIFEKLNSAMHPEFADEEAMNPFDLWEGANFKLKIRKVEGYQNYDKSEFEDPKQLLDDEDKLEAIWKSEYSLKEFLDKSNFKTYDELKQKLAKVLSDPGSSYESREEVKETPAKEFKKSEPKSIPEITSEDDDEMSFFKEMAKD